MNKVSYIPKDYNTITPYLIVKGAAQAIDYYKKVFGATEVVRMNGPDGKVGHAELKIGNSHIMLADENPAMGWRAIRIALDRPAMLRQQLRALLRAAARRHLRVMFPMVAETAELEAARALLDLEVERAAARAIALPSKIEVGVMFEVPALLWELPRLLPKIDFLSVGTNDLVQFLFAADRGNPRLVQRYDPLGAPVLRLLSEVVGACRDARVPVAVCGEMAGQPLDAMALIASRYPTATVVLAGEGDLAPGARARPGRGQRSRRGRLHAVARALVRAAARPRARGGAELLPRCLPPQAVAAREHLHQGARGPDLHGHACASRLQPRGGAEHQARSRRPAAEIAARLRDPLRPAEDRPPDHPRARRAARLSGFSARGRPCTPLRGRRSESAVHLP